MNEGRDRPRPVVAWLRANRRRAALWAFDLALACVAFGPLVTFDPEPTFEREFEDVFFEPSDSSPAFVLLLAAWFAYRRWPRFARVPPRRGTLPPAGALVALAGATLAWAVYTGAGDLRTVALMMTVQAFACAWGGLRAMRVMAVPTAFLVFAIPMPAPLLNVLLTHMQLWTASFTGRLLQGLGMSAYVTGIEIQLDPNHFAVIETCSGVRIIETLSMLTFLMIDLFRRSGMHALLLLALVPPVAFLFNSLRAVSLILNPYSEIAQIHSLQGIAMLIGGILVLYAFDGLLGRLLRGPRRPRRPRRAPERAPSRPDPRWATGVLAAFAALSLWLPTWGPAPRGAHPGLRMDFMEMQGWEPEDLLVDRRFLGRIGKHWDMARRFRRGRERVDFYLGVGNRSQRSTSVLFSKGLLQGGKWYTERTLPIQGFGDEASTPDDGAGDDARGPRSAEPAAEPTSVGPEEDWSPRGPDRAHIVVSDRRRYLMISWQEEADGLIGESLRSFLALDRSPLRRPGTPLVVKIATPIASRDTAALERAQRLLRGFYRLLAPKLATLQRRAAAQDF